MYKERRKREDACDEDINRVIIILLKTMWLCGLSVVGKFIGSVFFKVRGDVFSCRTSH